MFSAIRRHRREASQIDHRNKSVRKEPSPFEAILKNCQNSFDHASHCATKFGEELGARVAGALEALQCPHPKPQPLLLASISNSVEPKAILPSKNRIKKEGAEVINTAGGDDGTKEDEERILISEVRFVYNSVSCFMPSFPHY